MTFLLPLLPWQQFLPHPTSFSLFSVVAYFTCLCLLHLSLFTLCIYQPCAHIGQNILKSSECQVEGPDFEAHEQERLHVSDFLQERLVLSKT